MQPVQAVLFDFGMVLSGPPVPAVWAEMQRVSGLDEATLHRLYWAHRDDYDRGALDGVPYWERVVNDAGKHLTRDQRDRLLALDVELWTDMNMPMLAWVKLLHRSGIRTGILSNIGDAMADGIRRKFDWIGDFHAAVWSHALRLRKPEQAIYAAAADGLGVPAGHILFIDDKEENIRAAEDFGMQGIVYRDHATFEAEMKERGLGYLLHAEAPRAEAATNSVETALSRPTTLCLKPVRQPAVFEYPSQNGTRGTLFFMGNCVRLRDAPMCRAALYL